MPHRLVIVPLAAILLSGCATMTTTSLKPTQTIRNATPTEKVDTTRFSMIQQPNADSPSLTIAVVQQVTQKRTFQQRYVEKRVLIPGIRAALWFFGAAGAYGGYSFYQLGAVVLGRNLMGLGALVPVVSQLAASKEVGEKWKPESKTLAIVTRPAKDVPLLVAAAGDSTWPDTSNALGRLTLDISGLADMAEPGEPLTIDIALQEDSTQKAAFTIPASVVVAYGLPPRKVEVVDAEPPVTPVADDVNMPTLAIVDFEGIGVSAQEARVLTNRLGTQMVQIGRYQVIERGQMEQILQEQDFQLTGCISNECAVEIGQLIGAQQMLAGSFGKLGTAYTIDMRIIDVETGRILKTTSYDIEGSINRLLSEGLEEAVRRIAGIE